MNAVATAPVRIDTVLPMYLYHTLSIIRCPVVSSR